MIPGFAHCDLTMYRYLSDPLAAHAKAWSRAVHAQIGGSLGVVNGTILHMYHGAAKNRKYKARYDLIKHHRFDPHTDLEIDQNGLWQWSDRAVIAKPGMVRDVAEYFNGRKEDEEPS